MKQTIFCHFGDYDMESCDSFKAEGVVKKPKTLSAKMPRTNTLLDSVDFMPKEHDGFINTPILSTPMYKEEI